MDLLIHNVRIWDGQPLMDIGIRDGKIAAIEETIEVTAVESIDAGGRAVIPGLIEPHLHLDKAMLHRRLPATLGTLDEANRVTGIKLAYGFEQATHARRPPKSTPALALSCATRRRS